MRLLLLPVPSARVVGMSRTAVPVLIATCVLAGLAALSFVSRPLVPSPAGASNLRAFSESPSSSGGLGIYSCVKDACLQGADDDWVKICNDKSCYSNCTFDDDEWYEVCAMIVYACDNDDFARCEAYSYSYNVDDYTWGGGAER